MGTPYQKVQIPIDITENKFWLIPACTAAGYPVNGSKRCSIPGFYNPARSNSAFNTSTESWVYGTSDTIPATLFHDVIRVAGESAGAFFCFLSTICLLIKRKDVSMRSKFLVANRMPFGYDFPIGGLGLGLGGPINNLPSNTDSVMQGMLESGHILSKTYSLTLGSSNLGNDAGNQP
jgi:hypothetical protein